MASKEEENQNKKRFKKGKEILTWPTEQMWRAVFGPRCVSDSRNTFSWQGIKLLPITVHLLFTVMDDESDFGVYTLC